MNRSEVRSPDRLQGNKERLRLLLLAVLIVAGVGAYVGLRGPDNSGSQRNLLPYQALIRTLPDRDQQMYTALRRGVLDAEADRARLGSWPDPSLLGAHGVPPFASADKDGIVWQKYSLGATVNYLGRPTDPVDPAWLLVVQEPEPNTPPDPAPLDDEHHRLPDGTTLHLYLWTHRYGGRVSAAYAPQPQSDGWVELFATPPNPVLPRSR